MARKSHIAMIILIMVCCFPINCGKKGPLQLEPELFPTPAENLQVQQMGKNILLQWNFPKTFSDKKQTPLQIEKIEKIQVYYSNKAIPGPRFHKKAQILKKIHIRDLHKIESAAVPNTFSYSIPFQLKDLDNKDHFLSIQYQYGKKKSPLCVIAYFRSVVPAKPIANLKVTLENKAIKLQWTRPTLDEMGKSIAFISGYNVYKQIKPDETGVTDEKKTPPSGKQELPPFIKLNSSTLLGEYFEDLNTSVNGTYTYYVTAMVSNLVESDTSEYIAVPVTDTYPPEIPPNLVSFKTSNAIYLNWKEVTDVDFSHYRIYRRTETETDFSKIADNITANNYTDKSVKKETIYYYTVTAVDKKGNESPFSAIVKERF